MKEGEREKKLYDIFFWRYFRIFVCAYVCLALQDVDPRARQTKYGGERYFSYKEVYVVYIF